MEYWYVLVISLQILNFHSLEKEAPMSFEGFVSSSNEITNEIVEFETDQTVFFTTTNILHGTDPEE